MELMVCPKCKCDWFEQRVLAQFDKEMISFDYTSEPLRKKVLYLCVNCGFTIATPEEHKFRDIKIIVFARESSKINYLRVKLQSSDRTHVAFTNMKILNNVRSSVSDIEGLFTFWVPSEQSARIGDKSVSSGIEYGYCGLINTEIILLNKEEYAKYQQKIKEDYPEDKYNVEIVDKTED